MLRSLIYFAAAALVASLSALGQGPEIVEQTATNSSSVIWGEKETWIAALNETSISIFDMSTGRLSRRIVLRAVGGGTSSSSAGGRPQRIVLPRLGTVTLTPVPGTDQIATASGQSIDIYNVLSGSLIASAANSGNCKIVTIDNGRITGDCPNPTAFHPLRAMRRIWDLKTGKQISGEQVENRIMGWGIQRNGTWIAQSDLSRIGKQILSSLGGRSPDPLQMFRFTISDMATQQVLLTGPGAVSAISARAGTAITRSSDGFWLVQVPSGRHLQQLASAVVGLSAQPVLDGRQYLLSSPAGSLLVDAATGRVTKQLSADVPMTAGTVSPSGTRSAYPTALGVLIFNLPDTSKRQLLGTGSEEASAAQAEAAAATNNIVAKSYGTAITQSSAAERTFEKTLPRYNERKRAQLKADHRRDNQRTIAARQAEAESAAKSVDFVDKYMKPYLTFGGPAMVPPLSRFLNSGRLLAVLTADMKWSTWDTATGNRLSVKKATDLYGLSMFTSWANPTEMISVLKDKLAEIDPELKPRGQRATAIYQAACRSRNGQYLLDLEIDSDPKMPKANRHRVASAVLRSSAGTNIDLLAKGIDLSVLAEDSDAGTYRQTGGCSLSEDAKYLVVERHSGSTPKAAQPKQERALHGHQTSEHLLVFETSSGKVISELEGSQGVPLMASDVVFSPDNQKLAAARQGRIHLWQLQSGRLSFDKPGVSDQALGFSNDGKLLYIATSSKLDYSPFAYGIQIFNAETGRMAVAIPDLIADIEFLQTTPDGHILFGPMRDNALAFWDLQTGELLASMRALQQGEWLITTPSGYFDGSPRGWTQIAWRVPGQGLITEPAEIFFNEFYRPGLLAELLQGRPPRAPRTIQEVDRRQPGVSLTIAELATAYKSANISISVQEAPADDGHPNGSGVRDVRLFRNGMLVKVWRGDARLQAGKAVFDAEIPLAAGENHFAAYAFNHDNIKSADAIGKVTNLSQKLPGTAYILTIGVNRYANSEFNLKFAGSDAESIAETFSDSQTNMGKFARVVDVKLLDREATKANILQAFSLLSGTNPGPLPPSAPKQLAALTRLAPQDELLVYFAGHGIAWGDRFYLVPHDLGYAGPRSDLLPSIKNVLQSSISDQDLEAAFEPMQAGSLLLIIDACNSGKALESEEQRRGPLNSRGLAQLAYEKGIYVLTAAQSYQAALESSRLGHGYLTYALTEEGLKTSAADEQPLDGKITAAEWFEFASRRVPELQTDAIRVATEAGRLLTFDTASSLEDHQPGRLQMPRWYYRRDMNGPELVVAVQK